MIEPLNPNDSQDNRPENIIKKINEMIDYLNSQPLNVGPLLPNNPIPMPPREE